MKRLHPVGYLLVLVLLIAGIIVPQFLRPARVAEAVSIAWQARTGHPLNFEGEAIVEWMPLPQLVLRNVDGGPGLRAARVEAALAMSSLFERQPRIAALRVDGLEIAADRWSPAAGGEWDAADLPTIDIRDSRLHLPMADDTALWTIDSLRSTIFADGRKGLAGTVWREGTRYRAELIADRPFSLVSGAGSLLSLALVSDRGALRFDGEVGDGQPVHLVGRAILESAKARDFLAHVLPTADVLPLLPDGGGRFDGDVVAEGRRVTVRNARVLWEEVPFAADIGVDFSGDRPQVEGMLDFDRGAVAVTRGQLARIVRSVFDGSSTVQGALQVKAAILALAGVEIHGVAMRIAVHDRTMTAETAEPAGLDGGAVTLSASVDATRQPPVAAVIVDLAGTAVAPLVAAFGVAVDVAGTLEGNADVSWRSADEGTVEGTGSGHVRLRDGFLPVIVAPDTPIPPAWQAVFEPVDTAGARMHYDALDLRWTLHGGAVRLERSSLLTVEGATDVTGTVDIATGIADLVLNPTDPEVATGDPVGNDAIRLHGRIDGLVLDAPVEDGAER